MEVGKLKTVAIILLILVNISFASIWVYNSISKADIRAKEKSAIINVLKNLGVEITSEAVPADEKLYKYTIIRDLEAEAQLAAKFLGETSAEEMGGNIYYYESDKGKAQFRSSGNFEITLYDPELSRENITDLLAAAAFSDTDGTFLSTYNKHQVFNCRISIEKLESGETIISGIRLPGLPEKETTVESLSAATILLRFMEEINTEGIIIKKIERMYSGYKMAASLSSLELEPVWRIDTDSGTYYMDTTQGVLLRDMK